MRRIEFDKEQIEDIRQKIEGGISQDNVASEYKVSKSVIRRVCNENNICLRSIQEANKTEIPEDIAEKIIYNYCVLKKGLIPSGQPYGVSQFLVERILKEHGIRKRTYVESKDMLRKYSVNDNYFKTQTHNMAYIMGFIASDGNIAKTENRIEIFLNKKDIEILEKINKEIENTRPVKTYKRSDGHDDMAKIWTNSSTMKKDLAHYNIVPAKTFILKPPEFLDKQYAISYIRGYFDGDGSIFLAHNCPIWRIGSASRPILDWMRAYLAEEYGIVNNKIYYSKDTANNDFYYLQYSSKDKLNKLYDALYAPGGLYLQRKYDTFTRLVK